MKREKQSSPFFLSMAFGFAMQRVLACCAVIILLFVQFGSSTARTTKDLSSKTESLKSRTEWLSLLELRSSLGIRKTYWPKKIDPCKNWTGIDCKNGSVIGINVSGLKRTHNSSLQPDFAVDALSNFTLLESFNASGFVLHGSIPDLFGEINSLQVLDLSSCSISGPIPESIGGLSSLKILLLSGNDLAGRLPSSLEMLNGLSEFNISGNSLSGTVPSSLSLLKNLTKLDLSSNILSGYVPRELFNLKKLEVLNLSNNGISGSVPSKIGNLSRLAKLDLSMNSMSGSLPENLFSGLMKLEVLILSKNAFDGAVPDTLWSLPNLGFIDVSSNNLTGTLTDISGLNVGSSGAMFNLSNNMFYGNLNISVKVLGMIDFSGNYLQGEVQGGGISINSLARNCFLKLPNQRDFGDCRMFYAERKLPFSGGGSKESEPESRNNKRRVIFILAGIFGGFIFIVLLVLVLVLVSKRCCNSKSLAVQTGIENRGAAPEGESPMPKKDPDFVAGVGESFTYEQIAKLTGNFDEANIIKHGHSGDLFWGVLENGTTVVVKRVDLSLFKRESYIVELELLSKVSHSRLIPILGQCLENENMKCIVYKYMPNGDLATSLHRVTGADGELKSLDWITRLKIATGAAEGLAHLHDCSPPIVHRDLQASSILLDDKFEVRLGSLSEVTAQGELHQGVISRIFSKPSSSDQVNLGTSPVTSADDVYCFGKILLELVTGNIDINKYDDAATREWLDQTLPYITIYDKDRINKIVDPSLIVDEDLLEEVWAMAIVARSCLNPRPTKRPPMRHVLKALENPLKIVREESASSVRLRTTSSRRSWSAGFFGSWRQSSSESATATTNKESTSGSKQTVKVNSQGSAGNDHSSSNKRSSNEVFPEPLETPDVEAGETR